MKKTLAIIALAAFTFASCQKEETAQPELKTKVSDSAEKKDTSGWD